MITALAIVLLIFNFTRIKGSGCIRPSHIVALLAPGLLSGVLLVNIILLIRNRKP